MDKTILLVDDEAGIRRVLGISLTDSGNILLFVTQEQGNSLFIFYSVSRNGRTWSSFEPLVAAGQLPINFLPTHTSLNGREYTVFQAWPSGSGSERNYQLYLVSSTDGGYTWGDAIRLLLTESVDGEQF